MAWAGAVLAHEPSRPTRHAPGRVEVPARGRPCLPVRPVARRTRARQPGRHRPRTPVGHARRVGTMECRHASDTAGCHGESGLLHPGHATALRQILGHRRETLAQMGRTRLRMNVGNMPVQHTSVAMGSISAEEMMSHTMSHTWSKAWFSPWPNAGSSSVLAYTAPEALNFCVKMECATLTLFKWSRLSATRKPKLSMGVRKLSNDEQTTNWRSAVVRRSGEYPLWRPLPYWLPWPALHAGGILPSPGLRQPVPSLVHAQRWTGQFLNGGRQ